MNHDDHDDLWQLLGKARSHRVSPYFSRRVARAATQPVEQAGFWSTLVRYWQLPAMAACALAIAGGTLGRPERTSAPAFVSAEATLAALPDVGVIGHLDELLDSEKNSVWLAGDTE